MIITGSSITIHPDFLELADYLGQDFDFGKCNALDENIVCEMNGFDNYRDFIHNTNAFAYHSIGMMMSGVTRPYFAKVLWYTSNLGPLKLIDIGPGGGQIGFAFHSLGFRVSFAEIYSDSLKILIHRLRKRSLDLPIYIIDYDDIVVPQQDIAICFDVIQHLSPEEQIRVLHWAGERAHIVFVNLVRVFDEKFTHLFKKVNFDGITAELSGKWNVGYEDYYPNQNGEFSQRLLIFGDGVREKSNA